MLRIFILGSGRMAHHMSNSVFNTDMELVGIWARNKDEGNKLALQYNTAFFSDLSSIPADCDIYLFAVSDDAIATLAQEVMHHGIAVHTSGTIALDVFNAYASKAVFWPVQSLSMSHTNLLGGSPVCIECPNETDMRILEIFADKLKVNWHLVKGHERMKLHLAAVMVNNFSNHLFYQAEKYLNNNGLPFHLLMPLIQETVNKLNYLSPAQAQTGPANRLDMETMIKHLQLLDHNPEMKQLYKVISNSIIHIKNPETSLI